LRPEDKQDYLDRYAGKKRSGIPFFPDAIVKDVLVGVGLIVVLIVVSAVVGTPLEDPADPNDTTYSPRPEWYFLFQFQLLKYVPGKLEALGVIGVPLLLIGLLLGLPFIDRGPSRHFRSRPVVLSVTTAVLVGMGALTAIGWFDTPPASDVVAIQPGDILTAGREVFAANCAFCHGEFGEGGPDPVRTEDVIAPISTAQYLGTHGDDTIRSIISQGQPSLGMAPFALAYGGPLRESEVDAVLAFVRSWEENPPVELPDPITPGPGVSTGQELFTDVCAQCHETDGSGRVGPSLIEPGFQSSYTDPELFDTINLGHAATSMIAWGDVLTARQIQSVVDYIRELAGPFGPTVPGSVPGFIADVLPIFEESCVICHGTAGGWDATTREAAIESGANGPAVVPGDPDNSLLVRKLLGTQELGTVMPPGSMLMEAEIAIVIEWILAGTPE
jgi:mono/diheme cytochrome c family protein